jgi:hypothetical protein
MAFSIYLLLFARINDQLLTVPLSSFKEERRPASSGNVMNAHSAFRLSLLKGEN